MSAFRTLLTAAAVAALGLSLAPSAEASSINAFSGQPVDHKTLLCFSENNGSITQSNCGAYVVSWEIPLLVDSGGPFTIAVSVSPGGDVSNVACQAFIDQADGSWQGATAVVNPPGATGAQTIFFSNIAVPAGGTMYVACYLASGGRVNSVAWY